MPIYEFRCNECRRVTSVFTRSMSSPVTALCQRCGSNDLQRLISRVAVLRSEDEIVSSFDESELGDVDEQDPRSMARWVRKMSARMGEPLDAEMEADLDRMEAGEMPDDFAGAEDSADDGFEE